MDKNFIQKRISELRIQLGKSEYKMSIDLGHSKGYIQSISSGKSLPSLTEFLYICEYLGVTPSDFFNEEFTDPITTTKIYSKLKLLETNDLDILLSLVDRMIEKNIK